MYELRGGTKRLSRALRDAAEDKATVAVLARILHYYPEQLKQDIQALGDYITQAEERAEKESI